MNIKICKSNVVSFFFFFHIASTMGWFWLYVSKQQVSLVITVVPRKKDPSSNPNKKKKQSNDEMTRLSIDPAKPFNWSNTSRFWCIKVIAPAMHYFFRGNGTTIIPANTSHVQIQ